MIQGLPGHTELFVGFASWCCSPGTTLMGVSSLWAGLECCFPNGGEALYASKALIPVVVKDITQPFTRQNMLLVLIKFKKQFIYHLLLAG